jgi:hypothetical protein
MLIMSVINRSVSVLFVLFLAVLSASTVALGQAWHDKQFITDSFVKISLRREYSANAKQDMIRKWRRPIRVYVRSIVGDSKLQKEMVGVQLNHLAEITGHRINFVKNVDDANLIVVFTLKNNIKSSMKSLGLYNNGSDAILEKAACLGNIRANNKGEILNAAIHIPVDSTRSSGLFLNCVVEEITQVMGLLNDSDEVFPSIFNDYSVDGYLSGLDYLLLKLLYHPKIKIGMKEAKVRELVSVILIELEQDHLIRNASADVLTHSIRTWSGD